MVALVLGACSSGGGTSTTSPPALPSGLPTTLPSGLPTTLPSGLPTTLPSGLPTTLPSGLPSAAGFSSGTAHVEISGDVSTSYDVSTVTNGEFTSGGGIGNVLGLAFVDGANTFAVGGLVGSGSTPTSATLAVSFSTATPSVIVAASTGGECTVTLDDASAQHVAGSATCTNLDTGGQTVNVNVTFEASA